MILIHLFFFFLDGKYLSLLRQKDKLHSVMHTGILYQTRNFLWIQLNPASTFCNNVFNPFFFFLAREQWFYYTEEKTLFMHCSCTVYALFTCTVHRSHDIIHTFKNYFATVFSVFSFSNNKFNPNGP